MTRSDFYVLLADLILVVHFAFVAFVVLGLLFVWIGFFCRLAAVRNFYFRAAHLLAMAIVVAESLFGVICPLTFWESDLRELADAGGAYEESFMQHWIHRILFFDLGPAAFRTIYCVFFLALVLSFIVIRPHWPRWLTRRRAR